MAWLLIHLIGLLTNLALLGRFAWNLPSLAHLHPGPRLVIAAVAGGGVVALMARWAPDISGHGIPEAMEAVLTEESRISPRTAIAKPVSAAIAIGTGGPFGAEGPIIVTGGALGSLIGQIISVSPSERKVLLACGAAAGMAATFGTPLAAVVLAIELLLFEFSARAFIPLVVASALAGGVHSALFGTGPLFVVPSHDYAGLGRLPLFALLGVGCGVLAAAVNKAVFLLEGAYRRLPGSPSWHPVIGGLGFAIVGLVVPRALGVGYDSISDVLAGRLAVGALAALAAAKLVAWAVALASGTSGGTLAPLLLVSGASGSLFGEAVNKAIPGAHVSPGAFALVAMAAAFGASIRATFTAIVFLFELTRDYQIILPLMLASVLAEIVVSAFMGESLMTEKLTRRGIRVLGDYEVDVLSSTLVGDVMSTDVATVLIDETAGDARRRLREVDHDACPVVDRRGRCVGIVSRRDLLDEEVDGRAPVEGVATPDPVTAAPGETLRAALERMLSADVTHLPVLDETGQLVGICSRNDVLHARSRQFEYEHIQPGWHRTAGRSALMQLLLRIVDRDHPRRNQRREEQTMSHYLLVLHRTSRSGQLVATVRELMAAGPCRFHLLIPAVGPTNLFEQVVDAWEGDVPGDQASMDAARDLLDRELRHLREAGAEIDGEVGDPDAVRAVLEATRASRYDEVIVSSPPAGWSRLVGTDLVHRLDESLDIPVRYLPPEDGAGPDEH